MMPQNAAYKDYSDFLREHFPCKVQKISVNTGYGCPNRDGTIGTGGCIYCNNESFSPDYTRQISGITAQLEAGKQFFGKKYPEMRYLAYFQTYTNTYQPISTLLEAYREALSVSDVMGIIIATRPDCVSNELLAALAALKGEGHFVMIEYGVETSHDRTLERINRHHTWADAASAIERTAAHGIPVGVHLILGLPGESVEDMFATAQRISQLPVSVAKLHQLQVIRGTRLALEYERGEAQIMEWTVDEYIAVCAQFLRHLRPDIAIERFVSQSPPHLLIFPQWGLKNYEFTAKLRQFIIRKS